MTKGDAFNVFIWKDPVKNVRDEVYAFIKNQHPTEREVVVLHCGDINDFEDSIPLMYYLYTLCQQFNVFKDEKQMFLNPKDVCQAIELSLQRLKSENSIEANKFDDCVMQCYESYMQELLETHKNSFSKPVSELKNFLTQNSCIDTWQLINSLKCFKDPEFEHYLSKMNFLILGAIDACIFREVMEILNCEAVLSVVVETPCNISLRESPSTHSSQNESSITVSADSVTVDEYCANIEEPLRLESATEEYCEDILTAFLSLLISSRNELALSKVMISPFINLSHEAFTHLKHLSVEKEMPMCQTAISYVTRVRLGGKGYAPAADCPMLQHMKSLELFVDTLNHLQNVMEEDLSPKSSIKRLINILKKKLLKCEDNKLKPSAIEKVSTKLHSLTDRVIKFADSQQSLNNSPQICQATLDILFHLVNYINCSCVTFDCKKVLMQKYCKRTPLNLPPLLGYFRSPEENSIVEELSITNEDSIISNSSSFGYPPPLMSYFHNSDNSCSISTTCTENQTPTKVPQSFKDCIKIEEFVEIKEDPVKSRKRPALCDIANKTERDAPPTKSLQNAMTCNKKGSKRTLKRTNLSKKFKLIEGQGKITSFFCTAQK